MARTLALLLALAAGHAASGQPLAPPAPDLPPPTLRPSHSSAGRAYLYSAAATAGTVGLGLLLVEVLPKGDPTRDSFTPQDLAWVVVAAGAIGGPSVGNLTLGAGDDVGRAYTVKAIGVAGGGGLVLLGVVSALSCVADGPPCGAAEGLLVAGAVVTGAGLVAGTAYDLATIPRNAARARRSRQSPPVSVAPGWRGGGPALALRVGL